MCEKLCSEDKMGIKRWPGWMILKSQAISAYLSTGDGTPESMLRKIKIEYKNWG